MLEHFESRCELISDRPANVSFMPGCKKIRTVLIIMEKVITFVAHPPSEDSVSTAKVQEIFRLDPMFLKAKLHPLPAMPCLRLFQIQALLIPAIIEMLSHNRLQAPRLKALAGQKIVRHFLQA